MSRPRKAEPSAETRVADAPPAKARRWRQGPVNIGSLTGRLTRPALGKRGFTGGEILSHWPTIVGADLAAFACPMQVKFPRGRNNGATLQLRVAHGAAAALLQLKLPAIKERINRFYGYEAVNDVQASQGPLPGPPRKPTEPAPLSAAEAAEIERRLADMAPGPFRDALTKLGKSLQQRGR